MTERRRGGRKSAKEELTAQQSSKDDMNVAKYLRFNCSTKTGMFVGHEVHYFTGRKAVDTLLDSKQYGKSAKTPKFSSRSDVEDFLRGLLQQGLFFRAKVLVPKKKEDSRRVTNKRDLPSESARSKHVKSVDEKEDDFNGDFGMDTKKDDAKKEEEKKKKKVKLVAHDSQVFNDDTDVYVWVFDPTPLYKKIIGFFIVLGVILACLFPLWPDWLRLAVYYLSVTGISLFGLLLGVALLRTILFGIIYVATFGRHNLWILPNLTEDCGFFESFQPFYTYEYIPSSDDTVKKDDKKKESVCSKKKRKDAHEDVDELPGEISKLTASDTGLFAANDNKSNNDETDADEKYSKPGSDEDEEDNSSIDEEDDDDMSDVDGISKSNKSSAGDSSSEPVHVISSAESKPSDTKSADESETSVKPTSKPRRRRVRKADEDEYVMVQSTDDN